MRIWNAFNRRVVGYVFWALVIALAVNAFRIHRPTLRAAQLLPAKVVPYTVVLQEFQLHPDGTAVPGVKYTYAIRGDGSRASEMTSSGSILSTERIIDFSSGKKMYIMQHQQLKSTTFDQAKNRAANWLRDARNDCLIPGLNPQEKPEGEEIINGYRAVKLTYGSTTHWLALDYGCALIKDRAEWQDGQKSEKRLVALISGEPSPSLFEDPAGAQETPLSRLFPYDPNVAAKVDEYYESHRPPAPPTQ